MHLRDHIYRYNLPCTTTLHRSRGCKYTNNNSITNHTYFSYCVLFIFQASGGYNGLSTNIKMEDGMTPSIPTMKVGDLYVSFSWLINKLVCKVSPTNFDLEGCTY